MTTTLNASTSSGLVVTPDNSGIVAIQNNGNTELTVTSTGVTVADNLSFNSGYGSSAVAYGCRAWVNFNGTGTVFIRASGNVTSITDNGTGDFTVNFTNAMPDANYSWSCNITGYECAPKDSGTPITSSSLRIFSYYVSGTSGQRGAFDADFNSVTIFR
jgi:hypothetical protein